MEKLFLLDKPTMEKINNNINGTEGRHGLMVETHDNMFAALAPSPDLDKLNEAILKDLAPHINKLASNDAGEERVMLWSWLRHHFSIASMSAIYGSDHPFVDHPELEPLFWDLDANVVTLMAYPLPSITVRKGFLARQKLFDVMTEYSQKEGYRRASALIQSRYDVNKRHGLDDSMLGRGEGMLPNSEYRYVY